MKRIQGKKVIVGDLTVLTDSQFNKLENPDLREEIEKLAKRTEVKWAVEVTDNCKMLSLTREFSGIIDDATLLNLEIASANFINAIDELEIEKNYPAEKWKPGKEEVEFAKEILEHWDETDEEYGIIGARLLCSGSGVLLPIPCGVISENMLKCMFETFLEKYVYET